MQQDLSKQVQPTMNARHSKKALNTTAKQKTIGNSFRPVRPLPTKLKMLSVIIGLVATGQLQANDWQVNDGDWFDEANWQIGVPDTPDAGIGRPLPAFIVNGGIARISNGEAISEYTRIRNDSHVIVDGPTASWTEFSTMTLYNGKLDIFNGASADFERFDIRPDTFAEFNLLSGSRLDSGWTRFGNTSSDARSVIKVDGTGTFWRADSLSLYGNTLLTISNGGSVESVNNIGLSSTNTASSQLIVDGMGTTLSTKAQIYLTNGLSNRLDVLNGGQVSSVGLNIYSSEGTSNIVNVSGKDSLLDVADLIAIGLEGQDQLQIQSGAQVNSNRSIIGQHIDGVSLALIDGTGSVWNNNEIQVGAGGQGTLLISNGGRMVSNTSVLGVSNTAFDFGQGSAIISGADSIWQNNIVMTLGAQGTGEITLTDGGTLATGGILTIAQGSDATGRLNIGASSGQTAQSAGYLTGTPGNTIFFGSGDGAIVFNHTETLYDFDANIIGIGDINVLSGTTTLTGDLSGFAGIAEIDNGLLLINNNMANASTIINSGGTLAGSGTVGDVAVNGGAIAPGNSIGTLNVEDINFSDGGVYEVEVNANGSSDKIIATGAAQLSGGRVSVLPEPGDYAELTQYTILEAGNLIGEFDSVSVDIPEFAFLDASLDYTATEVALNLERNDTTFTGVANTPNTISTANALTQASSAGFLSSITDNLLILDNQGAQRAFESLSGNQLSQASSLSLFANQRFNGLLNNRSHFLASNPGMTGNFISAESLQALAQLQNGNLSALSDLPATAAGQDFTGGSGFWLTPQAGFGDIEATRNARGTDFNYGGLAAGFDHWFDNNLLLGASLGYSETRADDVDMDSFQGAVYSRWLLDKNRYLDGTVSLGRHQSDSERLIVVGNTISQAKGDYDIDTRSMALELGQDVTLDNAVQLTPFVGIQYTHLDRDSFTETGAGEAKLAVDDDRQESLRSLLGVKVAKSFTSTSGKQWDVDASLAWMHEFADNTANTNAAFATAPAFRFKTAGPELNRDRAQVGLGITTALSDNSNIRVGYQGEIASTDQDHSAYATFQFNW